MPEVQLWIALAAAGGLTAAGRILELLLTPHVNRNAHKLADKAEELKRTEQEAQFDRDRRDELVADRADARKEAEEARAEVRSVRAERDTAEAKLRVVLARCNNNCERIEETKP